MSKRKQTSSPTSSSTGVGEASIKSTTSSNTRITTMKKMKQEQDVRSNNLLRDRWISPQKTDEPEFYDHLLTDEGKQDLLDLDESEVYAIWNTILSIEMQNNKVSVEILRSSIKRLLRDVPQSGFGLIDPKCYEPFSDSNVLHKILEFHGRYCVSTFPDLISELIETCPKRVFTDQLIPERGSEFNANGVSIKNIPKQVGETFLHRAVRNQVPFWLLQSIYNAFPRAISLEDRSSNGQLLPFHLAIYSCCIRSRKRVLGYEDLQRLEFLFSKYPSAAGIPKGCDYSHVLHQLYTRTSSELQSKASRRRDHNQLKVIYQEAEVIARLAKQFLEVCPLAANIEISIREGIPLFFVCRRSCMQSTEGNASQMICDLLQTYPEGVFYQHRKEFYGLTPLQLPVNDKVSTQLLKQLCQSDCNNGDDNNNGQHHYKNCPTKLAKKILCVRDTRDGNTVLHVIFKMHFDMISYMKEFKSHPSHHVTLRHGLVPVFPQLTMVKNYNGDLPLHMRLKFGSHVGLLEDVKVLVEKGDTSSAIECTTHCQSAQYYPFMLAASREVLANNSNKPQEQQQSCVSTIFFLLQTYVALRGGLDEFY